jgi:DNA-binding response OmpR family regulator
MPRPTLLVAEQEPKQALSVRKLMLETAKFNVLTAHSSREALDLFHLFPNVSMAVLVSDDGAIDCEHVAQQIKNATDKVPIVVLSHRIGGICKYADHNLQSGEPESLLELVRSLLGDPRATEPGGVAA